MVIWRYQNKNWEPKYSVLFCTLLLMSSKRDIILTRFAKTDWPNSSLSAQTPKGEWVAPQTPPPKWESEHLEKPHKEIGQIFLLAFNNKQLGDCSGST